MLLVWRSAPSFETVSALAAGACCCSVCRHPLCLLSFGSRCLWLSLFTPQNLEIAIASFCCFLVHLLGSCSVSLIASILFSGCQTTPIHGDFLKTICLPSSGIRLTFISPMNAFLLIRYRSCKREYFSLCLSSIFKLISFSESIRYSPAGSSFSWAFMLLSLFLIVNHLQDLPAIFCMWQIGLLLLVVFYYSWFFIHCWNIRDFGPLCHTKLCLIFE